MGFETRTFQSNIHFSIAIAPDLEVRFQGGG
jgi:hypothetical protein